MIISDKILTKIIQPRPLQSHKGDFGRVLTIGGNINYGGAIIMATAASVSSGAGLVTCATNKENLTALHARVPEAMFVNYFDKLALSDSIASADVIILGPGLGDDIRAQEIVQVCLTNLRSRHTCIIDGSAITIISQNTHLKELATTSAAQIIYTPHQMEWQRLSQILISEQTTSTSQKIQAFLNATVILKKYHTEIFHKNKLISTLEIGGPYMATGGMGDTLAGILGGFIAQFNKNHNLNEIIDAAVYFHTYVAQELAKENYVVLPTKLISQIPAVMKKFE